MSPTLEEQLSRILSNQERIVEGLSRGLLVQRWMTLPDAARYLGMEGSDSQFRKLKRLLAEEGVKYKPGNGGKPIVRVADLDAMMSRNLARFPL